jgi:serine/threonine-protein kinase HipA
MPACDMNPSIDRKELTLAINEVETACDLSIAIDSCKEYGVTVQQADNIRKQVQAAVAEWRTEAMRLGIAKTEQDLMAVAFEG